MGVATTGTSSTRVFGSAGARAWASRPGTGSFRRRGAAPMAAEQERGGFAGGCDIGLRCAGLQLRIHVTEKRRPAWSPIAPRPAGRWPRAPRAAPPRTKACPIARGSPRPWPRGPGNTRSARRRTFPGTSAAPPPRIGRWAPTRRQLCALATSACPAWPAHRQAGRALRRGARRPARGTSGP